MKTTKTQDPKYLTSISFEGSNNQLLQIKTQLLNDVKTHLEENKEEVSGLKNIGDKTKINGEFFDDFLVIQILDYIPIDLKDILNLCFKRAKYYC
ncbi:MAG: hypothetical protein ACJAS6_001324 [Rickettsiales bacterium]|jgi:hypothetical protein